jgi:hypothetical protein
MHTDRSISIPSVLLSVLLLLCTTALVAQVSDSSSTKPFQYYWTKPRLVPKLGVGVQDRAFFEAGIYWQNIYKHPLSLASKGPYCTIDIFIDDKNLLLGPKLGYEFTAGILGVAADMTYFFDRNYNDAGHDRKSLVFTPKVGLTILGFADFFYGYQIPLSDVEITTIYRNRFSLVFNLNRDYFNLKEAPRRKSK